MRSCAVTQPDTRAISRAGSLAARRRCGGVQRGEEHCAAQLSRGIFFLQFTDSGYGQALAQPFTDCECRRKTHGTERKRNDDASGDLWDFSQWRGGSWLGAGYGIAEACAHDAVQDASERNARDAGAHRYQHCCLHCVGKKAGPLLTTVVPSRGAVCCAVHVVVAIRDRVFRLELTFSQQAILSLAYHETFSKAQHV